MKPLKRLFVALSASKGIEVQATQLIKKLKQGSDQKEIDVRWSRPENLHVTLLFLGETQESEIPKIKNAIQQVVDKLEPFSLKVENISAFPDVNSGRVVFIQVQRSQKILDLVTALEQSLGYPESTNYVPHMTIGRLRNPKSVKDMISPFVRKKFGKISVDEIILYESIQAGPYPVYKVIERFQAP
ncbi:MAG: RNA 2',3'-cyclic phosphodiesterase [Oligoflexia bacterium]|nr:MAG: RNA 2',3'-cyclic phosphodiesterase [Oligoflexia bacterium]